MEEEMLKDDVLKQPKKWLFATFVITLAVLTIVTFGLFHWLYAGYFQYSSIGVTVEQKKQNLKDVEREIETMESDARARIEEIEKQADEKIAERKRSQSPP